MAKCPGCVYQALLLICDQKSEFNNKWNFSLICKKSYRLILGKHTEQKEKLALVWLSKNDYPFFCIVFLGCFSNIKTASAFLRFSECVSECPWKRFTGLHSQRGFRNEASASGEPSSSTDRERAFCYPIHWKIQAPDALKTCSVVCGTQRLLSCLSSVCRLGISEAWLCLAAVMFNVFSLQ